MMSNSMPHKWCFLLALLSHAVTKSDMVKISKAKCFIPIVQSRHLCTIITSITVKYIASSTSNTYLTIES